MLKEDKKNAEGIIGLITFFLAYVIVRLSGRNIDQLKASLKLPEDDSDDDIDMKLDEVSDDDANSEQDEISDDIEHAEAPNPIEIWVTPGNLFDAPNVSVTSRFYVDAIAAVGSIDDPISLWRKADTIASEGKARIDLQKKPFLTCPYYNFQAQLNGKNMNGKKASYGGVMIHQDLAYEDNKDRQDEILGHFQKAMITSLTDAETKKEYRFQMVEYKPAETQKGKTYQSNKKQKH